MSTDQYQSSVEVGQPRAPELLPPPDELANIQSLLRSGTDVAHACAEVRRLGLDHPAAVGTPQVISDLTHALSQQGALTHCALHKVRAGKPDTRDHFEVCRLFNLSRAVLLGARTFSVHAEVARLSAILTLEHDVLLLADEVKTQQAASALVSVTAAASMREYVRQVPGVWDQLASCLQLPASSAATPELLTLCGNLAADDVNAKAMSRSDALTARITELLFHSSRDVQIRACACTINLATHQPSILRQVASEDQVFLLLKRLAGASEADTSVHRTALLLGLMCKDAATKAVVAAQLQKVSALSDTPPSTAAAVDGTEYDNGEDDADELDDAEALDAAEADMDDLDTTQAEDDSVPVTPE